MWPIETIQGGTTEAIKERVDFATYRAFPGLNPSVIKHGVQPGGSMKHLKYAWENPREDTDDLLWGRAVHCLLFEPKEFEHRYIAWREVDGDGKPKARKGNKWDELVKTATELELEILSLKQWNSALEAAKSFIGEPEVQRLIAAGQPEVMLLTVEEGLQCKCRIDWIASGICITDLKTTKCLQARAFGYDFYKYGYDVQLGLYRRALNRLTGKVWPVQIIALEKAPPYDIAVIPVPEAVLERGAEKGLEVIRRVHESIVTNTWPGLAGGELYPLEVPYREMEDVELEGAEAA